MDTVFRLADKYDAPNVSLKAAQYLSDARLLETDSGAAHLLAAEPLRVFAIACKYAVAPLALQSAKQLLHIPIVEWRRVNELRHVSGWQLKALMDYHMACSEAANALVMSCLEVPKHSKVYIRAPGVHCHYTHGYQEAYVCQWMKEYLWTVGAAVLRTPCRSAVLDIKLEADSLELIGRCESGCNKDPRLCLEFDKFKICLAKEIQQAILKVGTSCSHFKL
jgi:hypothetical protein